ncbi:MAG TPA: sodium-dependent bicarbonate transport family permease [Allosphingosinicella sp.]|nr:sodium-dependent bicarbonate transport family permease [Allosphingosinicella sp.]
MEAALTTLTSPVILFFLLGGLAAFARSDLAIPEAMAKGLSIYLMIAIGLKGGIEVSKTGFTPDLLIAAAAGLALSFLIPFVAFGLLRTIGKLDKINAGAVAAHYGSVSVVTFVAASEILTKQGLGAAGYMVAVLALMETPAIISGLFLARRGAKEAAGAPRRSGMLHEVLLNASVVLLVGSFLIGLATGPAGYEPIKPVFDGLFRGLLAIFLLDMGLVAGRRLLETRSLTGRLAALAVALPLLNGTIGTFIGVLIGLDTGSAAALGILAASASYIAVPAAMRLALPQADPGLYLSMSLGVTFPFNIIIGIPLFAALARMLS